MNKQKKAFITGINGQDGSYLAEYLLELGYEVQKILNKFIKSWTKLAKKIAN